MGKIIIILFVLGAIGAGLWFTFGEKLPGGEPQAKVMANGETLEPAYLSDQPKEAKEAYKKYEEMAEKAVAASQQRSKEIGQYTEKCTQIMTDFATEHGVEAKSYIDQNQEYLKKCIAAYSAQQTKPSTEPASNE